MWVRCLLAPSVASVVPSFAYVSLGWAPDFFEAWRARAVSNTVATLTLVPSMLIVCRSLVVKPVVQRRRLVEYAGLLLGLFAVETAASYTGRADLLALSITLYAMTPVLLWATVRFGGAGLSLALSATVLIISNAAGRMTPFAGGVPGDAIVGVQLLLTANAVPLMLLAGLLEQNRAEHRALVDMEQQTRAMLRVLPDMVLLHTGDGVILRSYPDSIDDVSKATLKSGAPVEPGWRRVARDRIHRDGRWGDSPVRSSLRRRRPTSGCSPSFATLRNDGNRNRRCTRRSTDTRWRRALG